MSSAANKKSYNTMTTFNEADRRKILESLTADELATFQEAFTVFDKNQDGTITTKVGRNHFISHSAAMVNPTNLQKTLMVPAQGERVYLKDFKYILFEILANRKWKGRTSTCRPSKPNHQIGLALPARACMALPCPIF